MGGSAPGRVLLFEVALELTTGAPQYLAATTGLDAHRRFGEEFFGLVAAGWTLEAFEAPGGTLKLEFT